MKDLYIIHVEGWQAHVLRVVRSNIEEKHGEGGVHDRVIEDMGAWDTTEDAQMHADSLNKEYGLV